MRTRRAVRRSTDGPRVATGTNLAPSMPSAITCDSAGGVSVSSSPTTTSVGQSMVGSVARLSGRVRSASSASMTPSASVSAAQRAHLDGEVRVGRLRRGTEQSGQHRVRRRRRSPRVAATPASPRGERGPRRCPPRRACRRAPARESPTVAGASTRTRCNRPSTTPPAPRGPQPVPDQGEHVLGMVTRRGAPACAARGDSRSRAGRARRRATPPAAPRVAASTSAR